jgi:hypothetical protein
VVQRNLGDRVAGQRRQVRLAAVGHHERQHVERARRRRRPPADPGDRRGEPHVARVAEHGAVRPGVPGVADELLVPDPRPGPARRVGREHRDHRADLPAVVGDAQVLDALPGDLGRLADRPQVPDLHAAPVEPADAARAVAPGDPRAERELRAGVLVGAGEADLRAHPLDAPRGTPGLGVLGVEPRDELDRLGGVDRLAGGRCGRGLVPR